MNVTASSIQLFEHQQRGVDIARERARFGFWLEPGTGKTIMMLAHHIERPAPTIVVAPKAIMHAAWAADARRLDVKITVVHGSPRKRSQLMADVLDTFGDCNHIMTMDPAPDDVPLLVTNFETFRRKEVRAWLHEMGIGRLIVDESSKLKNHDSQTSKAIIEFADTVPEVYLLSGTPAPNGPHEFWGALRCLSRRAGGVADAPWSKNPPNFWRWARHYCTEIKRRINGRDVITGWRLREDRREEFTQRLSACSWALRKEDCLDLPPVSDQTIIVELSSAERRIYSDVLDRLRADFDGQVVNVKAQAQLMKLRQIAGGTLYIDGSASQIGTSKLDAMCEIVESLEGEPVIVWAEFTAEIDLIAEALRKIGRKVQVLDGRNPKNGECASAFQDGTTDVDTLICHAASVGHGVTLTRARYAIYYSCGFSYELHQQSRDRIYRAGQTRKVTYYYLVADDHDGLPSVDRRIVRVINRKGEESNAIIDVLRSLAHGTDADSSNPNT